MQALSFNVDGESCDLFCVALRCDASGVLSRSGGQFASQNAMRYRLARTLVKTGQSNEVQNLHIKLVQ